MQTEKKSFHCVLACTCVADYSILHERACYLLYKKMLSYGFMSPIRYYNNQLVTVMYFNVSSTLFSTPFVLFSCTPFGTKSYMYYFLDHVTFDIFLSLTLKMSEKVVKCSENNIMQKLFYYLSTMLCFSSSCYSALFFFSSCNALFYLLKCFVVLVLATVLYSCT